MEFKKIIKGTGKVLAKTALISGGVAVDVVSQLPEFAAAKASGGKASAKLKSNACSRWFYDKAKEIKITDEKITDENAANE